MAETNNEPVAELDSRFSSDDATATPWVEARDILERAEVYWLSTVRPDGRPHVTTLLAVWMEYALYFCTGASERKARNLASNSHCVMTTGCNLREGLDVVVEGEAVVVTDEGKLRRLADLYVKKYDWHYTVQDGAFYEDGHRADIYEVAPKVVFGFGKGKTSSQTSWRF